MNRCAAPNPPTLCAQAFRKVANGPLWFGLPITSISNSEVVLNVNAASLQLVVNASPGKIMFGQVCCFWGTSYVCLRGFCVYAFGV